MVSERRYDAVGLAWEGVVAKRGPKAPDPLDAGLRAAHEYPAAGEVERRLRRAAAEGLLPEQALDRAIVAPEARQAALAAFWLATSQAWRATSEARALLPSLRYRGYGAFIVSEVAPDADWLGAWVRREGLAGYATIIGAKGVGPQLRSCGWTPERCLLVLPAASALASALEGTEVVIVSLAPLSGPSPSVIRRLPELNRFLQ